MSLPSDDALARATAHYHAGESDAALAALGDLDTPAALLLAGRVHHDRARFDDAERLYERALAGLSAAVGRDHPDYAAGLVGLGRLYDHLDRHVPASRAFEAAQAIYASHPDAAPLDRAACLLAQASLCDSLYQRRLAWDRLTQARTLIEAAGSPPRDLAGLLREEAWTLGPIEGSLAAVDRCRQALALLRGLHDEGHPRVFEAAVQLARFLVGVFQLDEAASLLEAAEVRCREYYGPDHPQYAFVLDGLALLRAHQSDFREAERLARQALDAAVATYGEAHTTTAKRHRSLAYILQQDHRLTAALDEVDRAIDRFRRVYRDNHPEIANALADRADLLHAMGRRTANGTESVEGGALEIYAEALALLASHPDDVRPEQCALQQRFGQLRLDSGEVDEAAELLAGARRSAEGLPGDTLTRASLLLLEVRLIHARGDRAQAARLLGDAERSLAGLPSHHPFALEAAWLRAFLAAAAGSPDDAVRIAREIVARLERASGPRSSSLPWALDFLGDQLHQAGLLDQAENAHERALALHRGRHRGDHPDIAASLRKVAHVHLSRGNEPAAEVRLRQALDMRRACLGDDHPDVAESLHDIAAVLQGRRDFHPAVAFYRNAVQIREASLGPVHPDTLASRHGLALSVWGQGESTEAVDLLEETIARLGEDNPQRLPPRHALGLVRVSRGETAIGLHLLEDVLSRRERLYGIDHFQVEGILIDLAQCRVDLGDHLTARGLFERLRRLHAAIPWSGPLQPALDLVTLSGSYLQLGNSQRALDLALQALRMAELVVRTDPSLGEGSDRFLVEFLMVQARASRACGAFRSARNALGRAQEIVVRYHGDRHPILADLWTEQALVDLAEDRPERVTPLLERAANLRQRIQGEDHPEHAAARQRLAAHLQTRGQFDRAEAEYLRALTAIRRTFGDDHPRVILAMQPLAELHLQRGRLDQSETVCRDALDLIRRSPVPLDGLHAAQMHHLGVIRRRQGRLDEAANLFRETLVIDQSTGVEAGSGHLDSLHQLALVEAARGHGSAAADLLLQVLTAEEGVAPAFGCLVAGPRRDALLGRPWLLVEQLLTLLAGGHGSSADALTALLRWKGVGQAGAALGDRATLRQAHPHQADDIDRLIDLNWQIAMRRLNGVGLEGMTLHRQLLQTWETERDALASRLAGRLPVLARLHARRSMDTARLRHALPPDTTFIELVKYRSLDFLALCQEREDRPAVHTLAFVLRPGSDAVAVIDDPEANGLPATGLVIVASDDAKLARRLLPTARVVRSGREVIDPASAIPERRTWGEWFRSWLGD